MHHSQTKNRGDRILNDLRGASLHESQYGARGGSRRIGDLAVPSDLLEVRGPLRICKRDQPITPTFYLWRHSITGLSVQSILLQFYNCFYVLILWLPLCRTMTLAAHKSHN